MADGAGKPSIGQRLKKAAESLRASIVQKVQEVAQLDFFARFKSEDDGSEIDFPIDIGRDTVWATQAQMAALFGVERPAIAKHIKNLFDSGEIEDTEATHSKLELVHEDGGRSVSRRISHYNLDIILTVGYRVSGTRAAAFRKWANGVLRGYIEDGYAINGSRLKSDPQALENLAAEVRAIRTSEKAMYQKVRETFAACAIDYDPSSDEARKFFAYSQDAFHYAVSDHTAAQLIVDRCNHTKPNLGMVGLGNKMPTFAEAKIAKNYMTADELRLLELLGESWLIYAEGISRRNVKVSMSRLLAKVHELIKVNEYSAFPGYENLNSSRKNADEHVRRELERYKKLSIK